MTKQNKTITAQDVADLAGVSRAVVSRALSNSGSIAPKTRSKVQQAAEQLGYQVNFLAQGLNRKRTQLIGIVVTRLDDPFRAALLQGLLLEVQQCGFQALVMEVHDKEQLENTITQFIQYRVSGVVITSGQPPTELARKCSEVHIPVVTINRRVNLPTIDSVCSDNKMAAELVLNMALKKQSRGITWINGHSSTWAGLDRGIQLAYVHKNHDTELKLSTSLVPDANYECGYHWGLTYSLSKGELIYAANSQLACGVLDGLKHQGLIAPDDYLLIGFDDTFVTQQDSYSLSVIHQNVEQIAKLSIQCLLTRGANHEAKRCDLLISTSLVARKTTGSY